MRKQTKLRILLFSIIMSSLFFISCAVKRKSKEVERVEVKTENQLKNDSLVSATFKIIRNQSDLTINSFESILKALNVQYDGEQGNDLKVVLNRTENGTELNVSGKGKANYNEAAENTYNLTKSDILAIYDSLKKIELQQNKAERGQLLVDSFKSDTEKEKIDVSIWIYVVIGSVLVVGTVVYITIKYF